MKRIISIVELDVKPSMQSGISGYDVYYPDGSVRWSNGEAVECHSRAIDSMTFGFAVEAMRKGCKVTRREWGGEWIALCSPNTDSAYFYMFTRDDQVVRWVPGDDDILADDWRVV